jgi:hypothetical protein
MAVPIQRLKYENFSPPTPFSKKNFSSTKKKKKKTGTCDKKREKISSNLRVKLTHVKLREKIIFRARVKKIKIKPFYFFWSIPFQ